MNNFEIEECLNSMIILVDTREQDTDRARSRYARFGVPYRRCTLGYGDYGYNIDISGKQLYDESKTIACDVVIERKMSLDELAACFGRERERFTKEMERAKEHNATVYLLVENASWENLINGKYRSKYNSKAFVASITAWMARYDIKVIFCKSETSGALIKEILYREVKERLTNGGMD